jgi:hypothetical protein
MKRIPRDPEKFEVISLFNAIGQKRNFKINDKDSEKAFLESVSTSLTKAKDVPIILHGRRVEAMFAYVAASLGRCIFIKQEDAGEIYATDLSIRPPDYRVVLEDGTELFIEVKNCHKTRRGSYTYYIRASDLNSLQNYAALFDKALKISIYWSEWGIWTLLSPSELKVQGGLHSISLGDATKVNEMGTIGDMHVGTTPPLSLRFVTDANEPRKIDDSGIVEFTIGSVELSCGGNVIQDEEEESLAFYLMLYGNWPFSEPRAVIENNELLAIEFLAAPAEEDLGQGFSLIGPISTMIARRYNELTAPKGKINTLTPQFEPGSLGMAIPKEYKGKQLRLWRFFQKPNYAEITKK